MDLGGTEIAMIEMMKKLLRHNYSVTLLLIEKSGDLLCEIPNEIIIKELDFNNNIFCELLVGKKSKTFKHTLFTKQLLKSLNFFYKQDGKKNNLYPLLLKYSKKELNKYDLLLDFHGYGYFLTAYGAINVNAKKKALWFHDESLGWVEKTKEYFLYYDKLFCVSESTKHQLFNQCPEYREKMKVLFNFIDINRIREKAEIPIDTRDFKGNLKLLTIGRLKHQKGIDYAIKIASILKKRGIKFNWYIIGEGKERFNLEVLIKKYNVSDCFTLLGLRKNPYPYLMKCDLYIQPSRHEGYSITIIEAKALAKTIVTSNLPSMKEQISNGINGYLVPLNEISFANKIEELISYPELKKTLENNLRNEKFNFLQGYEEIEKLLNS